MLLKGSETIVGHCGLNHLERGPDIEIAYLFDDVERIVAVAFPQNVRSIAVLERIGMPSTGVARHFDADVVKYEALRNP